MQTSDDNLIRTISKQFGGNWYRVYANSVNANRCLYVFESDNSAIALIVVRNDRIVDEAKQIGVPGAGIMYWHEAMEDPALKGLSEFIAHYQQVKVLRYRPGKRMTISANDTKQGDVIIKCVASGISPIHQRLSELWRHRSSLSFEISKPLSEDTCNTFVQSRVSGRPLAFKTIADSKKLGTSMAEAVGSLHRSRVNFVDKFVCRDQEERSNRYIELIIRRFPDLSETIHQLARKLRGFQIDYDSIVETPLVPIHGSLHSHQWLHDNDCLALVDFDRACMGHAELDVATFLAEWDYEPGEVGDAVVASFKTAYPGNVNPNLLCYYRAHKHLAKTYKASKAPEREKAYGKTKRNLFNALALANQLRESA